MEAASDKTYISSRILEQYAKERQQRMEKKRTGMAQNLSMAAGKTFGQSAILRNIDRVGTLV